MKIALKLLRSVTFSPQGLLAWAVLILAVLALSHLLGFRDSVTILTGTIPLGAGVNATAAKALVYMAAYFAGVLLVPPMLLTSLIIFLWKRRAASLPENQ